MMKLLLLTIALFVITSKSQPGGGDMQGPPDDGGDTTDMGGPDTTPAGDCDVNGATSTYSETIDGNLRLISASGCPNHYSECTGKNGECIEGETEASITNITVNIPAYPCFNNYTDDSEYNWAGYPVYCLLDNLGIMLNGVSIFSPTADQTCRDAIGQESESFDTCGGHAGPTGAYHYHAAPACLLDQIGDRVDTNPDGHSPQIGWAYDGFPVYGPHGLDGEYILLCTQNNSNSSDCLDNCSGHSHHTIDGFKYHYHVAGPVGDLETSPLYPTPTSDRFPYTFGCFRGIPSDWSQTTVGDAPELVCAESGVTDDYVPKTVDGITEVFYYPAQDDTDSDATTMTPTPAPVSQQEPAERTLCDVDGGDAEYEERIDGELRRIYSNGCPNHYSECTGKEIAGICVPDETEAAPRNKTLTIPAYPCFSNYTDDSRYNWEGYPVYCLLGDLGIALNGVSIYSPSANTRCEDAMGDESNSFDTCGGHAGPGGGYHYHAAPACLLDQVGDRVETNPAGHSPQVGWAYDGFPVYGPHGNDGEYILLCTQEGANQSDCLDNCSGHRHHTIDGFKYHYHLAGPVGDLETSPLYPLPTEDRFPYTFGCYRGIPTDWSQTTLSTPYPELSCIESGVTDDYVATAVDGITDMFYYPAQDATTTATPIATTDVDTDSTPSPTETSDSDYVQITGWIYANDWFQLYFNGELVATDAISATIPNNAVYIDFTAPAEGSYSFAFKAQDNSADSTVAGGITIALSDGTVSSSDWRCAVVMEGTEYNDYADCWNELFCPEATMRWSSATEYTIDEVGYGISPNSASFDYPNVCSGLDATSTEQIYIDEGCVPSEKDWGDAVPIWTDDLDSHNAIICRYGYTVLPTSAPETTEPDTDIENTRENRAGELFRFYAMIVTVIGIIMI